MAAETYFLASTTNNFSKQSFTLLVVQRVDKFMAPPSVPGKVPTYAPNQTLYITNLPSSKIQKEDLRRSLYMLFSSYGPVLDVVALRTMKMRGQAHVVFRDIQTATQAMRALQGFEFFDREMVSLLHRACRRPLINT